MQISTPRTKTQVVLHENLNTTKGSNNNKCKPETYPQREKDVSPPANKNNIPARHMSINATFTDYTLSPTLDYIDARMVGLPEEALAGNSSGFVRKSSLERRLLRLRLKRHTLRGPSLRVDTNASPNTAYKMAATVTVTVTVTINDAHAPRRTQKNGTNGEVSAPEGSVVVA